MGPERPEMWLWQQWSDYMQLGMFQLNIIWTQGHWGPSDFKRVDSLQHLFAVRQVSHNIANLEEREQKEKKILEILTGSGEKSANSFPIGLRLVFPIWDVHRPFLFFLLFHSLFMSREERSFWVREAQAFLWQRTLSFLIRHQFFFFFFFSCVGMC